MSKDECDCNIAGIFMAGFFVGMIFLASAIGLVFIGDNVDSINTAGLGKIICEEYNMTYDHRVFNEVNGRTDIPTIYCKSGESGIIDGVVRKI